MLKQQLQQKLQQKLSPQQIQLIRLLELPAIELEERVKHELEDNPALEEGKEPSEASIIPSQIIMGESAQDRRDRQEDLLLQEKIRQGLVDSLEDFE
mgnify:CR=1 FL=1